MSARLQSLARHPRVAVLSRRSFAGVLATTWLWGLDRLAARAVGEAAPLGWRASSSLWGGHALAVIAVGLTAALLAGALWGIGRLAAARGRGEGARSEAAWAALLSAALVTAPASWVAGQLVSGEGIRQSEAAHAVRVGLTAILVLGAAGLGGWIHLPSTRRPGRGRWALVACMIGASAAASVLDVLVLPGLYPEAHLTLYALSAVCVAIALSRAVDELGLPLRWPGAVAAALLLAGILAWWRMSPADRGSVSQASPVAQIVIPYILPPVPDHNLRHILEELDVRGARFDEDGAMLGRGSELSGGRPGLSVLLLVVDTMRVDAVFRRPGGVAEEGDTPHLDALLADAFRFTHAYAPASKTVASMPPTFHSSEPHEDPDAVGQPLGVRLSELGLTGAAVVPQYFLMPVEGARDSLLAGFRHSAFVEKDRQAELPRLVDETFARLGRERYLGWVHFYSLHAPYYTDRLTSAADGSERDRYRTALRHLDTALHQVLEGLKARGQLDDTIVVLTSDHGEELGDNQRSGHGSTVLEEEVRVPLGIRIPGREGGDIHRTVGTIDLLPTLLDLLGAPMDPSLRGASLVPLMLDPEAAWPRSYLVTSGRRTVQGVVAGSAKLFLERRSGLYYRYDLAVDPGETRNLYADGPADRELIALLYLHNPTLASPQLADPAAAQLLLRRLGEIDPASPPASLPLLLELASSSPDRPQEDAVVRILREATSLRARLLAAASLAVADPARADVVLTEQLASLADEEATEWIAALARQRQPPFALRPIRRRMGTLLFTSAPESWQPWLELTERWPKPHRSWASLLGAMLRQAPPAEVLLPLLRNVATLVELPEDVAVSAPLIEPLLEQANTSHPEVARAAVEGLAHLGAEEAVPLLQQVGADADAHPRVRQAALRALAHLQGRAAVSTILAMGEDPLLVVDAIEVLRQLGDRAALPFLVRIRDAHYNRFTRERARAAIEAIEQGAADGGPG